MHPKTHFIAAHFGWHANDLKHAQPCSTPPNVVVEVGAILYDLAANLASRASSS